MTCENEEKFKCIWSGHLCTNLHHVALASKLWNLVNRTCSARVKFTVNGTTHIASYCQCDDELWHNYESGHGGKELSKEEVGLTKEQFLDKHNPGRAKCRTIKDEEKPCKLVKAEATARGVANNADARGV